MILSKNSGKYSVSPAGSWQVTTAFLQPIRSTFWERILALAGWISLLTSSPWPPMRDAAWLVFPPGAAHRSSTRSPGRGSSRDTTAMALGSWI